MTTWVVRPVVENAHQTDNAAIQQAVQWCGGRGTSVRARRAQQELDLAGNGPTKRECSEVRGA